jgi:outer membrane protein
MRGAYMNRYLMALVVTCLITFVAGTLPAQEPKIVYIDSQKILYESAAGKEAYKQLSTLKDQKEGEIQKRQNKLKGLSDSIQAKSATMSTSAKEDLEAQYEREMKDYNRYIKDAQDDLRRTEASLMKPWGKELDDIIKEYGEKHGIDLILDKANPVIIYSSKKIDITELIMDLFNKRYQEKSGKTKAKKE